MGRPTGKKRGKGKKRKSNPFTVKSSRGRRKRGRKKVIVPVMALRCVLVQ